MTASPSVTASIAVADPDAPAHVIKPNADGSLNVVGSSGGGAVTIADGADVAEGATTDAAYAGSGASSVVAALKGIYASLVAALPAGTNIIGKVGIDQTTPGTTNLVQTPTPASIVTGQYKLTASAVAISGSTPLKNGIVVKAKLTNAGNVWIGSSGVTITDDGTGNGYRLAPGEACSFACSNVNLIFAIGTANDVIYFEGN